jgi:hypothetical protein
VQNRHKVWINDAKDIEIKRLRRGVIYLIGEMLDQYSHLLEALQIPDMNLESSKLVMSREEESTTAELDVFREALEKKELDQRPSFEL